MTSETKKYQKRSYSEQNFSEFSGTREASKIGVHRKCLNCESGCFEKPTESSDENHWRPKVNIKLKFGIYC